MTEEQEQKTTAPKKLGVQRDPELDKYRIVDAVTGEVATNENGTPYDGGGHDFADKAERQMGYIQTALDKKKD
jgi:hypothetical protein